jgi:hypothetical protein
MCQRRALELFLAVTLLEASMASTPLTNQDVEIQLSSLERTVYKIPIDDSGRKTLRIRTLTSSGAKFCVSKYIENVATQVNLSI